MIDSHIIVCCAVDHNTISERHLDLYVTTPRIYIYILESSVCGMSISCISWEISHSVWSTPVCILKSTPPSFSFDISIKGTTDAFQLPQNG